MRLAGDFKSRAERQDSTFRKAGATIAGLAALIAVNGTSFASADQIIEQTLTADAPVATYQIASAFTPQMSSPR